MSDLYKIHGKCSLPLFMINWYLIYFRKREGREGKREKFPVCLFPNVHNSKSRAALSQDWELDSGLPGGR